MRNYNKPICSIVYNNIIAQESGSGFPGQGNQGSGNMTWKNFEKILATSRNGDITCIYKIKHNESGSDILGQHQVGDYDLTNCNYIIVTGCAYDISDETSAGWFQCKDDNNNWEITKIAASTIECCTSVEDCKTLLGR